MPGKGTDRQTFRLAPGEWGDYEKACSAKGVDRSEDLRAYVRREIRRWRRRQRQAARTTEEQHANDIRTQPKEQR
jgi:hypothetical protein